jgi:hypothetical protein
MQFYDIITIANLNNAEKIFLRGQFTMHRNDNNVLTWKWAQMWQMKETAVLSRMNKVMILFHRGMSMLDLKKATFISAEGAYSTLIFKSKEFNVLISGRMMSDMVTRPVVWRNGVLSRCLCDMVSDCFSDVCLSTSSAQNEVQQNMSLIPFKTRRSRSCKMGWLPSKDWLCGLSKYSANATNDVVLLKVELETNNTVKI